MMTVNLSPDQIELLILENAISNSRTNVARLKRRAMLAEAEYQEAFDKLGQDIYRAHEMRQQILARTPVVRVSDSGQRFDFMRAILGGGQNG